MAQDAEGERVKARALLSRFLPRAMEDGVLDEVEKRQLHGILGSGVLSKDDVQSVFREFLLAMHRAAMVDGLLTPAELARCRTIVTELRIPHDFLPPEIASIMR